MQSVLLVLEELEKIDNSRSVICPAGELERVFRLARLPRGGDRTRFVIRDETAKAVYRVAWRRSDLDFSRHPVVFLQLVESSGGSEMVAQLLLKAGFRPADYIAAFRRESHSRLMRQAKELSAERVRVRVQRALSAC